MANQSCWLQLFFTDCQILIVVSLYFFTERFPVCGCGSIQHAVSRLSLKYLLPELAVFTCHSAARRCGSVMQDTSKNGI